MLTSEAKTFTMIRMTTAFDRWLTDDDPYYGDDIIDIPDAPPCADCGRDATDEHHEHCPRIKETP